MAGSKVMITGLGNLGGLVLDQLVREPGCREIVVLGRDLDRLALRSNLAMLAAVHAGHDPVVTREECDFGDVDQVAHLIASHAPDVIFNALSLQSWWVVTTLPRAAAGRLEAAHFGPWAPMHLTLTHLVMQAVARSGLEPIVVNAAYPDVVNVVLWRAGLGPTVGIGNVANPVPALRKAVALTAGVAVERIDVRLVAHHYVSHSLSRHGDGGGAPYHLRALRDREDITDQLDMRAVLGLLPTRLKRSGGLAGMAVTAASAMTVLRAIVDDTDEVVHAPGPNGVAGGYPVRANAQGVRLALPAGLDPDAAIQINEEAQRYEGIERIEPDGTIVFSEPHMDVMDETLGYRVQRMRLEESAECAAELADRFARFGSRARAPRPARPTALRL